MKKRASKSIDSPNLPLSRGCCLGNSPHSESMKSVARGELPKMSVLVRSVREPLKGVISNRIPNG